MDRIRLSARAAAFLLCILSIGPVSMFGQRVTIAVFKPVSELPQTATQPSLRGAVVVDPADYPALFREDPPGAGCVATLIGPRALITAAHCVPDAGKVSLQFKNKTPIEGTCTHAPGYNKKTLDYDLALCLMTADTTGFRYETVLTDSTRIKKGDRVRLTGYGCTTSKGTGADGKYRAGEAVVDKLPSGTSPFLETDGQVALCFGDSGGPVFAFTGNYRAQIAVNSSVLPGQNTPLGTRSYLMSLSVPEALAFFEAWRKKTGAVICGLGAPQDMCRLAFP